MAFKHKVISVSILLEQMQLIRQEQQRQGCSVSEIIRRALNVYFTKPNKMPARYQVQMKKQDYEKR